MPVSTKSPMPSAEQAISDSSTNTCILKAKDDSSEKRKRTVHIDVYCTGTDDDLNDEDGNIKDSSFNNIDSRNMMQKTILEDNSICITHTEAKDNILPRGFQDENAFLKCLSEKRDNVKQASVKISAITSPKEYDSDDMFSSLYPSQFSSCSKLRDVEPSIPSSTSIAFDEYDSASATSWKDTISDMDSLMTSKTSIIPCDSFDYVDSVDQKRIKQIERMMKKAVVKSTAMKAKIWRPQTTERKYLFQKKMMRDFIKKYPPIRWSSESSESSISKSDDDSGDEIGWSFVSSEENGSIVTEKLTLPHLNVTNVLDQMNIKDTLSSSINNQQINQEVLMNDVKSSIFHDRIGPFGLISPSSTPTKLLSRITSPFTTPQGEKTDHIMKASIFGRVMNTVKKPGHHVGPAKNPVCLCEHCRRHFEEIITKGRSRSLETINQRK
jgi:hypothetical protein